MSKFTEGTWHSDEYGCFVFAHGTDMIVCEMRGMGWFRSKGITDEEALSIQAANARLIAAAPEMYELLKMFAFPAEYDNTVTAIQRSKAQELLARIDRDEGGHD